MLQGGRGTSSEDSDLTVVGFGNQAIQSWIRDPQVKHFEKENTWFFEESPYLDLRGSAGPLSDSCGEIH